MYLLLVQLQLVCIVSFCLPWAVVAQGEGAHFFVGQSCALVLIKAPACFDFCRGADCVVPQCQYFNGLLYCHCLCNAASRFVKVLMV